MVVGIPEIEADPAAVPLNSAFHLDAEHGQAGLPGGQVLAVDRERHVGGPGSIVAGEDSPRDRERMERLTALEEEEHRGSSGIERREDRARGSVGGTEVTVLTGREVQLVAFPRGEVEDSDFAVVEAPVGRVGPGQVLVRNVVANLTAKQDASPPFELSVDAIERQVIGYEAFKLESYVTSGVFPKRYFGYLDGERDTGAVERSIRGGQPAFRKQIGHQSAQDGNRH